MSDTSTEPLRGAFRFKRFTIRQDRCPMKVGTDGVLLGAWAPLRATDRRILDIGTGTGLIAVMLAQRAPGARITGIDIDDVAQARENGDASPWRDRLQFVQSPVQQFFPGEAFDLIVSNPPFYVDSLTCPDPGRTSARHAVHLPYGELLDAVVRLLAPEGRFAVVLPLAESRHFRLLAGERLQLLHLTTVRTTPRRGARRVLMSFARSAEAAASIDGGESLPQFDELVIGTGEHESYTPEYRALTRDFYLKF